jgi:hypothetical protein
VKRGGKTERYRCSGVLAAGLGVREQEGAVTYAAATGYSDEDEPDVRGQGIKRTMTNPQICQSHSFFFSSMPPPLTLATKNAGFGGAAGGQVPFLIPSSISRR